MQVKIESLFDAPEILDIPTNESGFYKAIAENVSKKQFPNTVTVTIADKAIVYNLTDREGTCNIQEESNNITFKVHDKYPMFHLDYADFISAKKKALNARGEIKLGGDRGSNKFYQMEQDGDKILAKWGSLGGFGKERSCYYNLSMYWIKYFEKINKGYKDNTETRIETPITGEIKTSIPKPKFKENPISQKLFKMLSKSSFIALKRTIKKMYVTQGMVDASKKYLAQLYETKDLDSFNKLILELCMVCPRNVWDMKTLMATSKNDIPKVLTREENLVQAMEGLLLSQNTVTDNTNQNIDSSIAPDPFGEWGISIQECNDKDKKEILSMLPSDLTSRVLETFKVYYPKHEKRFAHYCAINKIKNTRLLWHGSSNQNWLSIIQKGLLLKPNARIHGKMFGNGIYFAPSAHKSLGYTDGGYWEGGARGKFVTMGIYETAYGNPYYPNRSGNYTFKGIKKLGCNCLHARAGCDNLRNEEIVFYNESAMCIRYIVTFKV